MLPNITVVFYIELHLLSGVTNRKYDNAGYLALLGAQRNSQMRAVDFAVSIKWM